MGGRGASSATGAHSEKNAKIPKDGQWTGKEIGSLGTGSKDGLTMTDRIFTSKIDESQAGRPGETYAQRYQRIKVRESSYPLGGGTVTRETAKAVLIEKDGKSMWLPKSQIQTVSDYAKKTKADFERQISGKKAKVKYVFKSLSTGSSFESPTNGTGRVVSNNGGIVTVKFDSGVTKRFAEKMLDNS